MRPELKRFLHLYEAGAYFESHETLESAWLKTGSGLYRALILIAAAYCKRDLGNAHGLVRNLLKAQRELDRCTDFSSGIDVDHLRVKIAGCLHNLQRADIVAGRGVAGDGSFDRVRLQSLVPHLKIPLLCGAEERS